MTSKGTQANPFLVSGSSSSEDDTSDLDYREDVQPLKRRKVAIPDKIPSDSSSSQLITSGKHDDDSSGPVYSKDEEEEEEEEEEKEDKKNADDESGVYFQSDSEEPERNMVIVGVNDPVAIILDEYRHRDKLLYQIAVLQKMNNQSMMQKKTENRPYPVITDTMTREEILQAMFDLIQNPRRSLTLRIAAMKAHEQGHM